MCYRGPIIEGQVICPKCGEENPLERTHCQECGEPLVPPPVIAALQAKYPDVPVTELRVFRR